MILEVVFRKFDLHKIIYAQNLVKKKKEHEARVLLANPASEINLLAADPHSTVNAKLNSAQCRIRIHFHISIF